MPLALAALARQQMQRTTRCRFHWRASDMLGAILSGQAYSFVRSQSNPNDGGRLPDARGYLQSTTPNVPRFGMYDCDGDGVRETCALVLEPQATNKCLRSQELDNAAWTAQNVTVAANARRAPDGTLTADDMLETVTNGVHYLNTTSAITITAGAYCTLSVFVRRRSATDRVYAQIAFENGGDRVSYRLKLDTLGELTSPLGSGVVTNSGYEALADGWYRMWVTGRVNAASTAITCWIRVLDDTAASSYAGDTAKGLSYWGVQFEEGNTTGSSITSYLPTVGASVQRPSELLNFANFQSIDAVPTRSLTLYFKFVRPLWYAHTGSLEEYPYLMFGAANPRYGLSLNRDARTALAQLSDATPTFASVTAPTLPTTATIEVCQQCDLLRSAPTARLDVGSGFGAWSANAMNGITQWGSASSNLGVPSSPQYNPKVPLIEVKVAGGLYTLDEMRGLA